jgi:hypothetical protein
VKGWWSRLAGILGAQEETEASGSSARLPTEMLRQAAIPTPTSLLAQMLALRVAELPADDRCCNDEHWWAELPVAGERMILISMRKSWSAWSRSHVVEMTVQVATPCRDIIFTGEEAEPLRRAMTDLMERSVAARKARRDAENQHLALDTLERML